MAETKTPLWKDTDFLGKVVVPAAGAGLSAYGALQGQKMSKEMQARAELDGIRAREQANRTATAEGAAGLYTQGLNDQFRRSSSYLDAAPLGWAQDFERQNATREMLAPGAAQMANFRYKTGDPNIDKYIGDVPQVNFDMGRFMASVGKGATAASIGDRERALQTMMQGKAAPSSLGSILGSEGMTQQMQSQQLADMLRSEADEKEQLNQQYVMGALEGNLQQAKEWREKREAEDAKKKSGDDDGFMKKLGKFATNRFGQIAANFIPVVGPAVSAAMAVANSKLNGGSWKQAALAGGGAALGGAGGAIAGKVGGNAVTQALVRRGVDAAAGGMQGGLQGAVSGAAMGGLMEKFGPQPNKPFGGASPTAPNVPTNVAQGQFVGPNAPLSAGGFSTPGALGGYQFGGGTSALDQYLRNQRQQQQGRVG